MLFPPVVPPANGTGLVEGLVMSGQHLEGSTCDLGTLGVPGIEALQQRGDSARVTEQAEPVKRSEGGVIIAARRRGVEHEQVLWTTVPTDKLTRAVGQSSALIAECLGMKVDAAAVAEHQERQRCRFGERGVVERRSDAIDMLPLSDATERYDGGAASDGICLFAREMEQRGGGRGFSA